VVELLAHLSSDGRPIAWPVAVVAESPDDTSMAPSSSAQVEASVCSTAP
jgi:hypothetical protein